MNYFVSGFFHLAECFQGLCYSIYQYFILFYGWIIPHFIYPFVSGGTFWLFPPLFFSWAGRYVGSNLHALHREPGAFTTAAAEAPVVSNFCALRVVLLLTCVHKYLFEHLFSTLWSIYLGVEFLGHVVIHLIFWDTVFSSSCTIVYSHHQCLHILTNICYFP